MSDEEKSPPAPSKDPAPPEGEPPRAWGTKLLRFDQAWTRLDTRLCTIVLLAQISLLVFWAVLNAMTRDYTRGSSSALVVRILVSAGALGAMIHVVQRVKTARARGDDGKKWI